MTSPLLQEQNRKRLQGQAGINTGPVQNDEPKKLNWEVNDQNRVAQQQAIRDALQAKQKPLATSIGTDTFTNRLAINRNIGETATAGVRGAVQTQQAAAQAAYEKQQAELSAQSQAGMNADGSALASQYTSAGGSQGQYTGDDARLAQVARAGGFAEKDVPMAIAIMKAESGGNARALNTSNRNGSTDTGIFQINSIHSAWTKNMGDLNDPIVNAKAAKKIFDDAGGSWKPWSTFNNGAYNKFLKQPSSYTQVAPGTLQPMVASTGSGLRNVAVDKAMHSIGVPYVWGGNSLSKGVDCSGLVQQVYGSLGMKLPRTADEQSKQGINGKRVNINTLKPGDLVGWQGGWRGSNYVGHIAIYAGNGEIIEAPHTGATVRRRKLTAKDAGRAFGVALKFPGE